MSLIFNYKSGSIASPVKKVQKTKADIFIESEIIPIINTPIIPGRKLNLGGLFQKKGELLVCKETKKVKYPTNLMQRNHSTKDIKSKSQVDELSEFPLKYNHNSIYLNQNFKPMKRTNSRPSYLTRKQEFEIPEMSSIDEQNSKLYSSQCSLYDTIKQSSLISPMPIKSQLDLSEMSSIVEQNSKIDSSQCSFYDTKKLKSFESLEGLAQLIDSAQVPKKNLFCSEKNIFFSKGPIAGRTKKRCMSTQILNNQFDSNRRKSDNGKVHDFCVNTGNVNINNVKMLYDNKTNGIASDQRSTTSKLSQFVGKKDLLDDLMKENRGDQEIEVKYKRVSTKDIKMPKVSPNGSRKTLMGSIAPEKVIRQNFVKFGDSLSEQQVSHLKNYRSSKLKNA